MRKGRKTLGTSLEESYAEGKENPRNLAKKVGGTQKMPNKSAASGTTAGKENPRNLAKRIRDLAVGKENPRNRDL